MIQPVDQPTPPEQVASQLPTNLPPLTQNNPSFEAPQNWGTLNPSIATNPVGEIRESLAPTSVIPSLSRNPENETDSSPSVLKIILISLALILLGVLLGVLAAKFFQPTSSLKTDSIIVTDTADIVENTPLAISETPTLAITPISTPASLLKSIWKIHQTSSYKLFYPQDWILKATTNKLTLSKQKNIITISTTESKIAGDCNDSAIGTISKESVNWIVQEASVSSRYYVCESDGINSSAKTSIGAVDLTGTQIKSIIVDEFKYLLQKIELASPNKTKEATPSSSVQDLSS